MSEKSYMRLVIILTFSVLSAAEPPTIEETAILDLLNQYRANQQRNHPWIDRAVLHKEISVDTSILKPWHELGTANNQPQPPVVFNPVLIEAARALLATKIQPVRGQSPDPTSSLRQVGYQPDSKGLVIIGPEADTLPLAFAAACVHIVAEKEARTGLAHPVFAATEALRQEWREAGVAVATNGGKSKIVMILGAGSGHRYAGGVVYVDANRNGRFDSGEGLPGATVKTGDASMTTGPSGAWWSTVSNSNQFEVTFSVNNLKVIKQGIPGTLNLRLDCSMPIAADSKVADRLLSEANKAMKGSDPGRRHKALAALVFGTRRSMIDDQQRAKIDALIPSIREEYLQIAHRVVTALTETPTNYPAFKVCLDRIQTACGGSYEPLIKEADIVYRLRERVDQVQNPGMDQYAIIAKLIKDLEKAQSASCEPLIVDALTTWIERLTFIQYKIDIDAQIK